MKQQELFPSEWNFFVRGVGHYNLHKVIKELSFGDELDLVEEPENPFDPNAIRISYFSPLRNQDVQVGYVPKELCLEIKHEMNSFESVPRCSVLGIYPDQADFRKLKVRIISQEIGVNNEIEENL
jgi:hypothetical protein